MSAKPTQPRESNTIEASQPVLSFDVRFPNSYMSRLQLWAGNPGEYIKVSPASCHQFKVSKTASLFTEDHSHMHWVTEQPLRHTSTWQWIERWMERGYIAEGMLAMKDAKHWHMVDGKLCMKV